MEATFEREEVFSETSSTITTLESETQNVELKEGGSYATHEDFAVAVRNYAKNLGFK